MEMADYVAAINIAAKTWPSAAVKQPIVGETLISTYKPPIQLPQEAMQQVQCLALRMCASYALKTII